MEAAGPIRVVIADDHQLFRAGLRLILINEEGIALVGEAILGLETIEVVSKLRPDVVLLDISTRGVDGIIDVIGLLKQKSPATKPLLLIAARDEGLIFNSLRAGAKGYLSRDASISDLTKAIQAVYQGELWVERKLIARFVEEEAVTDFRGGNRHNRTQGALTAREEEIVRLLASGGTNKEIAQALFITEKTVKNHLSSIFRKLNVTRRIQAVLYGASAG